MENYQWIDVLDRHAEGLQAGTDLAAPLLAISHALDRGVLSDLLQTARRVHAALAGQVRNEPRPAFVAQLKSQLIAPPPAAPDTRQLPDRRTLVWWAAGVGGVISAAGLGFLAYKAIGTGISGIMVHRAARPALPEAQTAP